MSVKLIAFDLDGTFLNAKKEIPPENLSTIRLAADAGIWIVPASGRIFSAMPESLKLSFIRYYIVGNGLAVYDSYENHELFSYEISYDNAIRIFDFAESHNLPYDIYMNDKAYISAENLEQLGDIIKDPYILKFYRSIRHPVPDVRALVEASHSNLQKIQLYFKDPDQRLELLNAMPAQFPEFNITSSIPYNIEINSALADKANALDILCRRLGFSSAEAMAFGDGINDIGMIRTAGIGVAMENGEPEVKSIADYITGSCNDAGVAKAIIHFIPSLYHE